MGNILSIPFEDFRALWWSQDVIFIAMLINTLRAIVVNQPDAH